MLMVTTVSKWGNSLGVRIPASMIHDSGLTDGDKVKISQASNGDIVIQKIRKEKKDLKAFGKLHKYANPDLIPLEEQAFSIAMEERFKKETAE